MHGPTNVKSWLHVSAIIKLITRNNVECLTVTPAWTQYSRSQLRNSGSGREHTDTFPCPTFGSLTAISTFVNSSITRAFRRCKTDPSKIRKHSQSSYTMHTGVHPRGVRVAEGCSHHFQIHQNPNIRKQNRDFVDMMK